MSARELSEEERTEVERFGIHPEDRWGWWSMATVHMDEEHHDQLRLFVLSAGVILYVDQDTHARMTTKDMRELGELLVEGADVLEARAAG